ncbi:PIG-L deacetylase family protein [Microvirga lotononidis]|uniref:Putative LmbE-like protein n=1 Tax=Microvirga lotononidis TaxID=864069 RepID=I4YNR4_9HYPH|nr:PIG-L family deacetylase [Microvirga lotononidis]EIM25606.1 putative LmbE-like protein [Microvirga lotononidis]WQO26092.1 PIG-L family deacetylase [Microvirga lotononidis]
MQNTCEDEFDLFLLPHQDDEFGAFFLIDSSLSLGRTPIIIFLTNGEYGRATTDQRNAESSKVLRQLGVDSERIWYLGTSSAIKDQGLAESLETIFDAVLAALNQYGKPLTIKSVYAPSWEGGHPDHDAAALLAIAIGRALCRESHVYQFPLYNSNKKIFFPYTVLKPILEAGPVKELRIPAKRRLKYLKLCADYKSQWRTFIGLVPFIFTQYVTRGTQQIQALTALTTSGRPHRGPLLYERRGWQTWGKFEQKVAAFRQKHELPLLSRPDAP